MSEQVSENTAAAEAGHMRTRDVRVVDLLPDSLSSPEDVAAALEGPICLALDALRDAVGVYDRGLALLASDIYEAVRAVGRYLRTGENWGVNDYDRAMGYAVQDFSKTLTHLAACHTSNSSYRGANSPEMQFSDDTMPFLARALAEAVQAEATPAEKA
jgi:hypothetical protein